MTRNIDLKYKVLEGTYFLFSDLKSLLSDIYECTVLKPFFA